MITFIKRWAVFIYERFNPFLNTITIFLFYSANLALIYFLYPYNLHEKMFFFIAGFVLIWLIFFHMRLFDEVKDYETDCEYNKTRPLPRKLVSLEETGIVTLSCLVIEIILSFLMGKPVFLTYICVLAFTLLMRMEFFIGSWLRPKLELYAVTHTLSAFLMSLLITSIASGKTILEFNPVFIYTALSGWFVFNVFEFGRKTFSEEEERQGVDSYSLRLKPAGAVFLLLINALLAVFFLWLSLCLINNFYSLNITFYSIILIEFILLFLTASAGIFFIIRKTARYAKIYRVSVSLFLALYYSVIAVILTVIFTRK